MQMYYRVQCNDASVSRFAHNLPMHLATRGHIHNQITLDPR
jgi:hypothetical protein